MTRRDRPAPRATLVVAMTAAILLAGCSGPSHHDAASSTHTIGTPSPTRIVSPSRAPSPSVSTAGLAGKFSAGSITFPSARRGLVTFEGFAGGGHEVSSWQDRTTDAGRTWTSGPVELSLGRGQPAEQFSTEAGTAFVSHAAGWAYGPSLFFTRDGGSTWRREPGRPAAVGQLAVVGSSTWLVGYPCPTFRCHATLLRTGRVGGRLTPLTAQPVDPADIDVLLRPSATTAWALAGDGTTHPRLITTLDAGGSWHSEPLPCRGPDTEGISADRPSTLYLTCGLPSPSTCGVCGTHVLYRSTDDGVHWTRLTPRSTRTFGRATPTEFIQPVGATTWWAVHQVGDGTETVVRSDDGARRWRQVLADSTRHPFGVETFLATGVRRAYLVTATYGAAGTSFEVRRTEDGGRSWQTSILPIPHELH